MRGLGRHSASTCWICLATSARPTPTPTPPCLTLPAALHRHVTHRYCRKVHRVYVSQPSMTVVISSIFAMSAAWLCLVFCLCYELQGLLLSLLQQLTAGQQLHGGCACHSMLVTYSHIGCKGLALLLLCSCYGTELGFQSSWSCCPSGL